METSDSIWRPEVSSSSSPLGRLMNTLLSSRPRHLEAALSRIGSSSPSRSGSAGLLDDSLCCLRRHVEEAVDKKEPLDQILVPMIEHLLIAKGSKHCKQVLILMKWFFQDKLLCEALSSNIVALIMTKEDHFIRFGWCTLINSLVKFTINRFPEEGKQEMNIIFRKILYQSFSTLLSIICKGSIVQGEFELPTRLSIVAADCTLLLIEMLSRAAILRRKLLDSMSENQVVMLTSNFQKEYDLGQRISQGLEDMEMEQWLRNHLDGIIILVKKLQAWSRKSQPLHAKGLVLVLKWLQEIKQHVHNLQVEAGGNMLKSGILLCSCWKHYACLMRLEDNKFSQKMKDMLEEYISAIQYYTPNGNDNDAGKSYNSDETRKFFLNCLCLFLGRLDGKQLEVVITEHGPQLLNLLFSQLRYDDDLMEGSLSILRVLIFKGNFSSSCSLLNTTEMDMVLPSLLSFLDARDSIAKAVVLLLAEYCSVYSDGKGLQEIFRRLEFGDLNQKKNSVDVISELIHICSDLEFRQDIAKHLLKCLGDEDLMNYVEESNLLPQFDPHFVLPALVKLLFSGNEQVQSTASNAIAAVLNCHSRESSVILALLDCLSVLGGNPSAAQTTGAMTKDVHCSSMQSRSGGKLDIDRVLGLIPKLSESVENWKLLIEKVIDKMFQDPSNAIIVRFMSQTSEDLVEAGDLVLRRVLLHLQEQKKMEERWLSDSPGNSPSNSSAELKGSVFYHLSPLLLLRVLPLSVFDDIYSPMLYGQFCENLEATSGICIHGDDCIASLLVNRAFSVFEFDDVRKLAAELCGRLHPKVLFPTIESQLRRATQGRDILKMKICLFAICTSLVARDSDSAFHPAIHRIRKILEMVLLWPSFDSDEVSKVQHGCIDCLALMICVEVNAPETSKDFSRNRINISQDVSCPGDHTSTSSVLAYVIQRLTNDKLYDVSLKSNKTTHHEESFVMDMSHETSPTTSDLSTVSTSIPFRLCMANVLISACQKVSSSRKSSFACKVLPSVIYSVESIACSDVRAACLEVLFSAVYHLKSSVIPFSSDLFNLSVKALRKGWNKEKLAAAKLMASLMASEDEIIATISGGLLEAKSVLEKAAMKASSPELQQLCNKLLACLTSVN